MLASASPRTESEEQSPKRARTKRLSHLDGVRFLAQVRSASLLEEKSTPSFLIERTNEGERESDKDRQINSVPDREGGKEREKEREIKTEDTERKREKRREEERGREREKGGEGEGKRERHTHKHTEGERKREREKEREKEREREREREMASQRKRDKE